MDCKPTENEEKRYILRQEVLRFDRNNILGVEDLDGDWKTRDADSTFQRWYALKTRCQNASKHNGKWITGQSDGPSLENQS